ncbi:MAG: ATP-binding protein, partial [Candidatus Poribacteria bacterium]|nr:ATP-binding protein [Candidatus Poribacteria bacterium]
KLKRYTLQEPHFLPEVEEFKGAHHIERETEIARAQQSLDVLRERLPEFRLPGAPKNLGSLQNDYADYRRTMAAIKAHLADSDEYINNRIEEIRPTKPRVLLEKQLARQAAQIHRRIRIWKGGIESLQRAEYQRIRDVISHRNKLFHSEAEPVLHRFDTGELSYAETSELMDRLKQRVDEENEDLFTPYVGALESLQESVDLEHLATFGMEEVNDLRVELERLNSLAQLGIAVEIVGHELQSYDDIIGTALKKLPKDLRDTQAVKDIEFGYEGLTDQLRFLSPLRLAGQKIQRWVEGAEIADYVGEFFAIMFAKNKINFVATETFRLIRVYDQPSRLYPVFINLVNNSIYWVGLSSKGEKRIVIDVLDREVVVSDSGPGVDPEDIDSLFTLFFTRKARGGRGVGLYLCRSNLTAGGHRIRYEKNTKDMPLDGANFLIHFRGAELDNE